MFRKIVTYLVCFCIAFNPVVQATDPDLTILHTRSAYAAQIDNEPIKCLDVRKSASGIISLAFDPSLHVENTTYHLSLNRQTVGKVFFQNKQLNFWGYSGHTFHLQSAPQYQYPLFYGHAFGNLTINGGCFSKDAQFIAENLTAKGNFKTTSPVFMKSKKDMTFEAKGDFKLLGLTATKLLLNAAVSVTEMAVHAQNIEEKDTSKIYATQAIEFSGYTGRFNHKGMIKSKNSIVFEGSTYEGHAGSHTLAGGLFFNRSTTLKEFGEVAAGVGQINGDKISYGNPFKFTGCYFLTEAKQSLDMAEKALIQVQDAVKVFSQGTAEIKGLISHIGSDRIESEFPYEELFGLQKVNARTQDEAVQMSQELWGIWFPLRARDPVAGIYVQALKELKLASLGILRSSNDNVTVESPQLKQKGAIQSGLFKGVVMRITTIYGEVSGSLSGQVLETNIQRYLKISGALDVKHVQVVFTEADIKEKKEAAAKAAQPAAPKAKQEADAKAAQAPALKAKQEAEAKAVKKDPQTKVLDLGGQSKVEFLEVKNANKVILNKGETKVDCMKVDSKHTEQKKDNKLTIGQQALLQGQTASLSGQTQGKGSLALNQEKAIDIKKDAKVRVAQADYKTKTFTLEGESHAAVSRTDVETLKLKKNATLSGDLNSVKAQKANQDGKLLGKVVDAKFAQANQTHTAVTKATEIAAIHIGKGVLNGENHAPTLGITGDKVDVGGANTGDTVSLNITEKLTTQKGSKIAGEQVGIKSKRWQHGGETNANQFSSQTEHTKLEKGAKVEGTDSFFMEATKGFDNKEGVIKGGTGHLKTPTSEVGSVSTKKGLTLETPTARVDQILAGKHKKLNNNPSLTLILEKSATLTKSPTAPFNVVVVAPSVKVTTDINSKKNVHLEATKKDVTAKKVRAPKVALVAPNGAVNAKDVRFTEGAHIESKKTFVAQGDIEGKGTLAIKAHSVTNLRERTIRSDVVAIKAVVGDIRNFGVMQGRRLLERIAKGYVLDEGKWQLRGNIPFYIPAKAIGGCGVEMMIDGKKHTVGLISVAGKKVRNIGSYVSTGSGADAYIDGKYGIENISEAKEYLAASWTKRHGMFKHKKTSYEHWSNVVAEAKECIGGGMFRSSELGGFYTSGSLHAGQGEDVTNVHGPIKNVALVLNDVTHKSKKRFWGLSHSSQHQTTQQAQITRYLNNGGIYHTSRTAELTGQGTLYMTPTLLLKAAKHIHFDEVLLNHSLRIKTSVLSPTIGGIPLLSDHSIKAIPGISLYEDLRYMGQSGVDIARMVVGFQQIWSQMTGLATAYNNGHLGNQILSQFGEVGLSFTKTKSTYKWQTSVPATMHVGTVCLIAPDHVTLAGGTQVNASQLFKSETPQLALSASRLESSSKQKSFKVAGGYNPYTNSGSLQFGTNKASRQSVQYNYAQVNAPVVDLGNMDSLSLRGGNINCEKIYGRVRQVDVVTLQNESRAKQTGWGVNLSAQFMNNFNTTGGFNFNMGSSHQKQANQHSGITATQGFDKSFSIGQLNVTGIHLDPLLAKQAKQVTFKRIYDVNKSHSFGISMQGLDLSSGEALAKGLAKNTITLAAGAAAAEFGKAAGLGNQAISALTMVTTAMVSHNINEHFGEDARPPVSGIGILGQLNYGRNGHQVTVTGIDFSAAHFKQAAQNLRHSLEDVFTPEVPIVAPPLMTQAEEPAPILEEVPVEEKDQSDLRLKKNEIHEDAQEDQPENKQEKKQKSVKKEEPSRKTKESSKKPVVHYFEEDGPFRLARMEKTTDDFEEKNDPVVVDLEPRESLESTKRCLDIYQLEKKKKFHDDILLGLNLKSCLDGVSHGLSSPEFQDLLTHYPLNKSQIKEVEGLFQVFDRLGSDQKAPEKFLKGYEHLGFNLLYSWLGDDIMRLHLLSQIDKRPSSLAGYAVIDSPYSSQKWPQNIAFSIGKMPLVVARDTAVVGLIPKQLGNIEALGQGPVGYLDGKVVYINPASHQYVTLDGIAHETAVFGLTRGVGVARGAGAPRYQNITRKAGESIEPVGIGTQKDPSIVGKVDEGVIAMYPPFIGSKLLTKKDLGPIRGKLMYFQANLTMKNKDVANIFLSDLGGKELNMPDLIKGFTKIGEKTGAIKLELEGQFTNPEWKQFLIKNHNFKRGDFDWVRIWKKYGDIPHWAESGVKNWDKVTIPLDTHKIPNNILPEKLNSNIHPSPLKVGGKVLSKLDHGAKYTWERLNDVKNYAIDLGLKLNRQIFKPQEWLPYVSDPKAGKWNEFNVGQELYLNRLPKDKFDLNRLKKNWDPNGPFVVIWEGHRALPVQVRSDFSKLAIHPAEFAKYLRAHGHKPGQPVVLLSCYTASNLPRVGIQEISNIMRVPVSGFTGLVRQNKKDVLRIFEEGERKTGSMQTVYPTTPDLLKLTTTTLPLLTLPALMLSGDAPQAEHETQQPSERQDDQMNLQFGRLYY